MAQYSYEQHCCALIDMNSSKKLLVQTSRRAQLLLGAVCALISFTFGSLLFWLIYLITWRNPREFGTDARDLLKLDCLALLGILIIISVPFGVLASRLFTSGPMSLRLLSSTMLRVWGTIFAISGLALFLRAAINERWRELPQLWHLLGGSISMAIAAFMLARVRDAHQKN